MNGKLLTHLARVGAAVRVQQLQAETAEIKATFPDLFAVLPAKAAMAKAADHKHHHMSKADRSAVSVRMKAYWAKRRNGKTKAG